jgi:ElaB/YqjD/DUF883 family membrane-anchored ribosome-binding protein
MELYFKDLISRESTLETLVDHLMFVVQGADEFAQAAGTHMAAREKEEITSRLENLKVGCLRLRRHAIASAVAVDKVFHQYPYSALGFAFACGVTAGVLLGRQNRS